MSFDILPNMVKIELLYDIISCAYEIWLEVVENEKNVVECRKFQAEEGFKAEMLNVK